MKLVPLFNMGTFAQVLDRVQQLDIVEVTQEALEETADDFVNEQKLQLFAGIDSLGNPIAPSYASRKYAQAKNDLNPVPGLYTPDLYLTGAWYNGLQFSVSGDTTDISSTDVKDEQLEGKYTTALGLGGDYRLRYLTDNLGPVLQQKISDVTGLKFGQ